MNFISKSGVFIGFFLLSFALNAQVLGNYFTNNPAKYLPNSMVFSKNKNTGELPYTLNTEKDKSKFLEYLVNHGLVENLKSNIIQSDKVNFNSNDRVDSADTFKDHNDYFVNDYFIKSINLKNIITKIQNKYGIKDDGRFGPETRLNLITSNNVKIKAFNNLTNSLDEILLYAKNLNYQYVIVVNIASFHLHVFDVKNKKQLLESRVIIGTPQTKTPIFTTEIVNLKFNPDWNPPEDLIAKGEHYEPPGKSPLGKLRFSTTDSVDVFLHDTNQRYLFSRSYRDFSDGCIRVQKFRSLGGILSNNGKKWVIRKIKTTKTFYYKIKKVLVVTIYSRIDLIKNHIIVYQDLYDYDKNNEFNIVLPKEILTEEGLNSQLKNSETNK